MTKKKYLHISFTVTKIQGPKRMLLEMLVVNYLPYSIIQYVVENNSNQIEPDFRIRTIHMYKKKTKTKGREPAKLEATKKLFIQITAVL